MKSPVSGLSMLLVVPLLAASAVAQTMEDVKAINKVSNQARVAFNQDDARRGYPDAAEILDSIVQEYQAEPAWGMLKQVAAALAKNLGQHDRAQRLWDSPPSMGLPSLGPVPEGEALEATGAIVKASAGRRVVILNEAHHIAKHREFARRLLAPLREAGFTHLACEAFANKADEGYELDAVGLGYATTQTGYYISDPVFAEFVREALELGFVLVPYESTEIRGGPGENPAEAMNNRERAQARTLAGLLEEQPEARVLVYCGYSHLKEKAPGEGEGVVRWMATRLAEKTGLDPLTISQTSYYPRSDAGFDGAAYTEAVGLHDQAAPFVLSVDGGLWSADSEDHDIDLFHPRLSAEAGRPGWLAASADRKPVEVVPAVEWEGVAVLIATRPGEATNAVPADVVFLDEGTRNATLFLRAGEYELWLCLAGQAPRALDPFVVE